MHGWLGSDERLMAMRPLTFISSMTAALALLASAPSPAADGPPEVAALWDSANKAFRAKSYSTACDLYKKIEALVPQDGGAWSDLGLCLARLGKREEAIAADRKAIELGDERTRLNAYFNLAALDAALPVPKTSFDKDENPLERVPACLSLEHAACANEVVVCSRFEDLGGQGPWEAAGLLLFGTDRAALEQAAQHRTKRAAATGVELPMSTYEGTSCEPKDVCGDDPCDDEPADSVRCKPQRAKCRAAVAACSEVPKITDAKCVVVHADACRGVVGVVCGGKARELRIPDTGPKN